MWQKNSGKSETEIIQNQFTAYLATAVQRRRNDYLQQMDRRQQIESLTGSASQGQPWAVQPFFLPAYSVQRRQSTCSGLY